MNKIIKTIAVIAAVLLVFASGVQIGIQKGRTQGAQDLARCYDQGAGYVIINNKITCIFE